MSTTENPRIQDSSTVALSCCPKQSCPVVVARIGADFCERCGSKLQPISYDLWLDKFVEPALDQNLADLVLDPSRALQAAAEMGFSGPEVRKRLDDLMVERTGADSKVLDTWIRSTMDLFQEKHEGDQWGSARQTALSEAKDLKIEFLYAAAIVHTLAQRIESASGRPIPNPVLAETLRLTPETIKEPEPIPQITTSADSTESDVDMLRPSAISFYRNMVSGGKVSNTLTYLNAEKRTSASEGRKDDRVFLREVAHKQGTFVLFRGNDHGWVFPNPQLVFRPKAFTVLFPALTREHFNNVKWSIEPVRATSLGHRRWRVTIAENAQRAVYETETQVAAATLNNGNLIVAFPISAADYLKKVQSSARIVRHENVRGIIVSGPNGKGELALIDQSDPSSPNSSIVIPRITSFRSVETYLNLYQRYYECPRPSAGDVWIMEPATVEGVQGGWRLLKKGLLEIHGPQLTIPPPPRRTPLRPPEVEAEAVPLSSFSDPNRSRLIIAIIICTGFLIVVIASLMVKSRAGLPPNLNDNQKSQIGPLKEDPAPIPLDMVRIQPGTFRMGRDDGTELERPTHNVSIAKPFFIDTHEVTCQEYESFLAATPQSSTPIGWKDRKCPAGKELWPVSGINWYAAKAYAEWKGKRLPTEEEWEYAARGGSKGFLYPWGEVWKDGAANAGTSSPGHIVNVRSYPAGESSLFDMVGNVWEWTSSDIASYAGGRLPQRLANGDLVARGKIIRGGAWNGDESIATTTYRMGYPPSGASDYSNTGFRCVMDVPSR